MMFELFDEEYQRKQYNIAEAHRNEAKGIVKGMAKGQVKIITKLVENGIPLDTVLQTIGIST